MPKFNYLGIVALARTKIIHWGANSLPAKSNSISPLINVVKILCMMVNFSNINKVDQWRP